MEAPTRALKAIQEWMDTGRKEIAGGRWDKAEAAIRQALELDEHNAACFDLMATLFEAQGKEPQAAEWREKAKHVRRDAWQRQVEAEARGHHEMLGGPSRHEIP